MNIYTSVSIYFKNFAFRKSKFSEDIMKKQQSNRKSPVGTKRRLTVTVAMLLVACIVMASVSFAWLILSTSPEVTGIATTIGSNGSLEIALLNAVTKGDLSEIRTVVQGSLKNSIEGNYTWGNLVDLNDESFGLTNIKLLPARLNATKVGEGYRLDNRSLWVPIYSYDGRIIDLDSNVLTATFKDGAFKTSAGSTEYGVRALGTSNTVSAQASALALAKAQITAFTNSAKTSAISAIKGNDDVLLNIMLDYQSNKSAATFDDTDLSGLKKMIKDLAKSVEYIDEALRQAIIAYAASTISEEDKFNLAEDAITNKEQTIEQILTQYSIDPPEELDEWLDAYAVLDNDVKTASNLADALSGGIYTWAQISPIFTAIIDIQGDVFINDTRVSEMSSDDLSGLLGSDVRMTIAGGSGIFSDIANFTDNYSTFINLIGETELTVMKGSTEPAYLIALYAAVSTLSAADGSDANIVSELTSTYGYILDLAFRCNAPISDLLLQTDAAQRVYDDSTSPSTMGGGSYMEFPLNDHFSLEQTIKLVDAVRVAFVDDQSNILGVAKLNTSNRTVADNILKAPLYLYEYSLSENPLDYGAMVMGERKKDNNVITPLTQNVAKAISVVVWLDGDIVDNTMVSAESEYSVSGMLNLQFASSADLIPAENGDLMNMIPDKSSLKDLLDDNTEIYEAGQGMYTTVSWNAFVKAYEYAKKVYEDAQSNEITIYRAYKNLDEAADELAQTDADTLANIVQEYREMMGNTTEIARYVVLEGEKYQAINPFNVVQKLEKIEGADIYAVDKNKNLHDEGNDFFTPVYTDESWEALADALYEAELINWTFSNNLVEENTADIDKAITALELAYQSLERKIFYEPFDYDGSLYYRAITDDEDTYGKWYNSNFKRIVADLRIIELDSYAEPIDLVTVEMPSYAEDTFVASDGVLSGTVSFNNTLYRVLNGESIDYFIASDLGSATRLMSQSQKQKLSGFVAELGALTSSQERDALIADANALLDPSLTGRNSVTYTQASEVIYNIELFLAPEDATVLAEMKVDLAQSLATALLTASNIVQLPVLDAEGNDITEEHYRSLNEAIAAASQLTPEAEISLISDVFDDLNDALVTHGCEPVPYPTYALSNSAHGNKPMYFDSDTLDILLPVPTDDESSRKIGLGEIFVVTTNGILARANSKIITVYQKADGVEIVAPDLNVAIGSAVTFSAKPFYFDVDNETKLDTLPVCPEHIVEYTWASGDAEIITFDKSVATIKKAGTTVITLSAKTAEGNVYTASTTIEIPAP